MLIENLSWNTDNRHSASTAKKFLSQRTHSFREKWPRPPLGNIGTTESAARWHLWKILGISRITILENLEIFFQQYGYRFVVRDKTSATLLNYEHDRYQYSDTRMKYGIVRIINLSRPMQERLLEDSKLKVSKRQRTKNGKLDQQISWSNSNTTALHNVGTIKHKNGNIEFFWKLIRNIHNLPFYWIFAS